MKLIILCLVMCMLSTGCGEMLRRATSIDWDEVRRKNTRIVPGAGGVTIGPGSGSYSHQGNEGSRHGYELGPDGYPRHCQGRGKNECR